MNNKEKILDLYFIKHLKQNAIATELNVSTQYISRIVRSDERYKHEKELRKQENSKKRKEYLQEYFKNYDRPKNDDNSYQ